MFLVFKQFIRIFTHIFTYTYFQKIQTILLEQYYKAIGIWYLVAATTTRP